MSDTSFDLFHPCCHDFALPWERLHCHISGPKCNCLRMCQFCFEFRHLAFRRHLASDKVYFRPQIFFDILTTAPLV
ncbi:hypothetical protein L873DRAFT_1819403 [Choiromyces venosus 120613-1]|uniref:Uncharacterized protein n=1 Tax=Choiromyces venosus 120613-1 TaxID=1336337 RepID=A0A3N4J2K3_9PEZI|nr:hypothetical protein L873DRAFT_1819403 [Choiromyces venosus 120613-1]